MQLLLQLDNKIIHWFATMCVLAALTQVTAAVIVTSRFLFAMARDHAIPFANILIKTNQSKEPWVIDIVIIATLFAAVSAWYVNKEKYFNLSETFLLYFMAIPYVSQETRR